MRHLSDVSGRHARQGGALAGCAGAVRGGLQPLERRYSLARTDGEEGLLFGELRQIPSPAPSRRLPPSLARRRRTFAGEVGTDAG